MQSLDITNPERNPNSYTRDEILASLRALDGSRRITFRYDHLDSDDNKIRDISHLIESASMEVNELASIKRTANFTLEDDGKFNFLLDRIKIWCRVFMPPKPLEVTEIKDRRWFNTFNGTVGVTGDEAFDPVIAAHNGQDVSGFSGELYFSDDWSALGEKSLKMGTDGVDNSGNIIIETQPAERALTTFFFNIAASGHFLFRTGDTESGEVELVLDDETGTYSIGSLDLTSISGDLIGQEVRSEVRVGENGDVTVRFFWTDIHGTTPDYENTYTATMWSPSGSYSFEGGGVPAVYLDHVQVFEIRDSASQTSDEVNWVDFPLGVFLLETTSRTVREDGTNLVDVEAYDKLKILEDEALVGRLEDGGVRRVDDDFRRNISGSWGEAPPEGLEWEEVNTGTDTNVNVTTDPRAWGQIELTGSYTTHRNMLVPIDGIENSEIQAVVWIEPPPVSEDVPVSIVTRYQDNTNKYELVMLFKDDGEIQLQAWSGGVQIGTSKNTGVMYRDGSAGSFVWVRTRTTSDRIQANVWSNFSGGEPEQWLFTRFLESGQGYPIIDTGKTGIAVHGSASHADGSFTLQVRRFILDTNPLNYYQAAIEHLIGDHPSNIAPTDRVIPTTREWTSETSKRVVINDLLSQIDYHSLSVDENGVFYAQPYILPDDRTPEYHYEDNEVSVMTPESTREFDLHNVPNRWIMVASNPDHPPIKVVYENNDPSSPLSIPRRGRVITRTNGVEEDEGTTGEENSLEDPLTTEASSKATLLKKAIRLGNESTRVYEHVDFETAFMPFHSSNDCYTIKRGDLGVDAKYLEHKWSMTLDPGSIMSHRARRIRELDVSFDDSIVNDDLEVTGVFTAGNMAWGIAELVIPVPNTPTSFSVAGLDLAGTGRILAFTCAHSAVPGTTLMETSMNYPTDSGFVGYLYRTNDTGTNVHWFIMKEQ